MEAADLMIGDIVRLNDQIMEVTEICRELYRSGHSTRLCGEYGSCTTRKAKPVPLTEDLLKANGWEYDKEQFSWFNCRLHNIYGLPLFIDVDDTSGKFLFCNYITIDSVHELQHCLRLVGRKDLADNFKVEQV